MYKYAGIVIVATSDQAMSLAPLIQNHKYSQPYDKVGEEGVIGKGTYKDTYEHSLKVEIVKLNADPNSLKIEIIPRSADTADDAIREFTEDMIESGLV